MTEDTKQERRTIRAVRVENVKAVELVEIEPAASGMTVIAGANEQGKSSTLDSIWALVSWRKAGKRIEHALRRGTARGRAEVTLDDGTIIRREWTEKSTRLVVIPVPTGGPQSFVDALRPPDLIDPIEFSLLKPADRRDFLLGVSGLGGKLEEAERAIATAEELRRDANREAKRTEALAESFPRVDVPDDAEPVSTDAIVRRLEETLARQNEIARAGEAHRRADEEFVRARREVERLESALKTAREHERRAIDARDDAWTEFERLGEAPSVAEIRAELGAAEERNEAIRKRGARQAAADEARKASAAAARADAVVQKARGDRDALIRDAEFPLEGVGFDAVDATYNGTRWADIGTANQIRVGVALGLAQNPGLPLFLISRGESLDEKSMALLEDTLREHGAQALVEVVGGEGRQGAYVIEAGRVKA